MNIYDRQIRLKYFKLVIFTDSINEYL